MPGEGQVVENDDDKIMKGFVVHYDNLPLKPICSVKDIYGKALSMVDGHQRAIEILSEAKEHVNNTIIQTALGDSYLALGEFRDAEEAYQMAVYMLPDRFYPKYPLAKFYEETEETEQAIVIARELVQKEPKIPSTAVNEIKQEMERILRANDDFFSVRYSEHDREDVFDFANLPVEINRRVVISEECGKVNIAKLVDFSGLYSDYSRTADIPKLYMYGAYDYVLGDVNRSELIWQELQRSGNRRVIIEDEGHIINRSRNIQQVLQELLSFLEQN